MLANSLRKGKPRLKASGFASYISETLLPAELQAQGKLRIADSTANDWLHRLGLKLLRRGKGIDIRKHERPDVVQQRKEYIATMLQDEADGVRQIFEDETICSTAAGERFMWGLPDQPAPELHQKEKGQGMMILEFCDQQRGLLKDAGLQLEIGKTSYLNNPLFLQHVSVSLCLFCAFSCSIPECCFASMLRKQLLSPSDCFQAKGCVSCSIARKCTRPCRKAP